MDRRVYVVLCLLGVPLQHRRPRRLLNVAAAQARQILQRHDPGDGNNNSLLPRPPLLGGHSLRLQAQQLQHVPNARHDVGGRTNRYTCGGWRYKGFGNAVDSSIVFMEQNNITDEWTNPNIILFPILVYLYFIDLNLGWVHSVKSDFDDLRIF